MSTTGDFPDIRVRRCTVRVRRRGGRSWGDPAAYVDPVVAALEAALRRATSEAALHPEVDVTVDEPVILQVTADGHVTRESLRAFVDQLRAAATESLAGAPEPLAGPLRETGPGADAPVGTRQAASAAALDALVATLGRWSRAGRLAVQARSWPGTALDAWVAALVEATEVAAGQSVGLSPDAVEAIAAAVLGDGGSELQGADPRVRFLVLAGAVVAALGDRPTDAATLTLVALHTGTPADHTKSLFSRLEVDALPLASTTMPEPTAEPRRAAPAVGPAVVPALPFLVVVQLHRLGYLEPATAALGAAGVTPAAASLAAAVAGKVLDAPDRDWRPGPEELLAVELVSGLTPEEIDEVAAQWADRSEGLLVPLRSALIELYADGRSRYDEVVRTRVGDDVVIGEALGLLPIAWTGSDDAAVVLAQLGDPPLRESDVLAPLVAELGPRRGLPGHDVPELERLLGSVVGTALGSLAQELWGEQADALLALERMWDLEARVTVGDRVTVAVPRGQRWLDLSRAGLLDAWPAPWAPGGLWELVTW
jgi:hypothetical protein